MIQGHKSEIPMNTILWWEWKKLTNTCQYYKYHGTISDGLKFQRNTVRWVQFNYTSMEENLPCLERQWDQEKFWTYNTHL